MKIFLSHIRASLVFGCAVAAAGVIFLVTAPKAQAIFGVGDYVFDQANFQVNLLTSANTAMLAANDYALNFKEYTLDGIAWGIAKMILQQMTGDVVNWINSGFNGNPAFISNPQDFFLDVGDQLTGAFISDQGPLQALCTPFSADLRIGIARSQGGLTQRYTCTLGSIIAGNQNILNNISVNGKSVNGFMKGDFSQGGWSGFLALTTQPQNNPYGASLMTQSDLLAQQAAQADRYNSDLNRGNGFLSFTKCDNVSQAEIQAYQNGSSNAGLSWTPKIDGSGHVTWQKCHVETPGSVISNSLNKSLGLPADSLVTADEFNEILGALFSQLVSTVLSGGLKSSSQAQPGQAQSYINQVATDNSAQISNLTDSAQSTLSDNIKPAIDLKTFNDSALASLKGAQNYFTGMVIPQCTSANNQSVLAQANAMLSAINAAVASAQASANVSTARLNSFLTVQDALSTAQTPSDMQTISRQLGSLINTNQTSANDVVNAKQAMDTASTTAQTWITQGMQYRAQCGGATSNSPTP